MGFGRASESCPIMQSYRTSPPNDKRGGFVARTGDKAPHTDSPCPSDSRRSHPRSRPDRRPQASPSPRRSRRSARTEPDLGETPEKRKPFRRRRRFRPGRGRAEGQGRAIRCSSLAQASPCSTRICAATRPPPERCARALRFRAPRPPPRSSASTPTKARCAICASPSATPAQPRGSFSSGATSPPGRPASTSPGSPPRRPRSTWPWTRTASQPA